MGGGRHCDRRAARWELPLRERHHHLLPGATGRIRNPQGGHLCRCTPRDGRWQSSQVQTARGVSVADFTCGPRGSQSELAKQFPSRTYVAPLISRAQHNLDDLVATPARDGIEAAGFTDGVLDRPSLVAALAAANERFMQIDVLEYSPAAHEPKSDLARVDVSHVTVRTFSPRSSTRFMMRPTGSRTSSAVKNAFCNPGSVPWAANTDTGNRWLSGGDRPQAHPAIAFSDVAFVTPVRGDDRDRLGR